MYKRQTYFFLITNDKCRQKGDLNMQITDVRVRKVSKEGKMKAVVSILWRSLITVSYTHLDVYKRQPIW